MEKLTDCQNEEVKQLEEKIALLEKELKDTKDFLEYASRCWEAERETLLRQYSAVADSQVWKLTKPLRLFLDFIKKSRVVRAVHKFFKYCRVFGVAETFRKLFCKVFNITPKEKGITTLEEVFELAEQKGATIFGEKETLKIKKKTKKILFISHEMDLSGAPIALQYFMEQAKKQGNFCLFASCADGALKDEITKDGNLFLLMKDIYQSDFVPSSVKAFDLVVVNTVIGAPIVERLFGCGVPVMWWIHESLQGYTEKTLSVMPKFLAENVKVYCVGDYATKTLQRFRPNYEANNLLYCVPEQKLETENEFVVQKNGATMTFAVVGLLIERKGHEVLIDAIRALDESVRKKCKFLFVGNRFEPRIYSAIEALAEEFPNNVEYVGTLSRGQMNSMYSQIDCLICCSKDDPMPIVVTEAMMLGKTVICSKNSGSAKIIEENNAGFIYENNDPKLLAKKIEEVLNADDFTLKTMRENARKAYENYFSPKTFDKNVNRIISNLTAKNNQLKTKIKKLKKAVTKTGELDLTVSVIIPTYNAGAYLNPLLDSLSSQKGIRNLEVIAVDSGSTDGTVEKLKTLGAKVIEIKNQDFTHSYARNLGATNAKGDVIIFMTQDALPENEQWAYNLALPIAKGEAVAVSCGEKCPGNIELYYKISSWANNVYVGAEDRTGVNLAFPDRKVDLRKEGALNDVTCAVNSAVFSRYLYRYGFGEDLDLGIRLFKTGYKIKILSDTKSIHGHNRVAGYYVKRCFSDVQSMEYILPEYQPLPMAQNEVASIVCYSAKLIFDALKSFDSKKRKDATNEEILNDILSCMTSVMEIEAKVGGELVKPIVIDEVLQWVIDLLYPYASEKYSNRYELFNNCYYYFDSVIREYLRNKKLLDVIPDSADEIVDCVIKRFCSCVGVELALIPKGEPVYDKLQTLSKGV